MSSTLAWTDMRRLPDGHRMFFTEDPRRVAIVDNSGRTPELSDDGVLWINFDEPVAICGRNCFIPIIDNEGRKYSTPTDFDTTFLLSQEYGMNLNLRGILFEARRVR